MVESVCVCGALSTDALVQGEIARMVVVEASEERLDGGAARVEVEDGARARLEGRVQLEEGRKVGLLEPAVQAGARKSAAAGEQAVLERAEQALSLRSRACSHRTSGCLMKL